MLCWNCKGIILALRRGPWSCDSAWINELDKNWIYCKFTLENLADQPGFHVISNFCLTLCTYMMIAQNLMCGGIDFCCSFEVWSLLTIFILLSKYTVYLNIVLQIIFIHENSKRYKLSWKSYFMAFTKSLLILSTLSSVIFFFKWSSKIIWEWSL